MKIRLLLTSLLSAGYNYKYSGPDNMEVYFIQEFRDYDSCEDGILYYSSSQLKAYNEKICLISGDEGILNYSRSKILEFSKKKTLVENLRNVVAENKQFNAVAELCCEIMGNPVVFLKADFVPFFWIKIASKEDLNWISKIDKLQISYSLGRLNMLTLGPTEDIPFKFMICPYNYGTSKRYVLVVEREHKFNKAEASELLQCVCSALSSTAISEYGHRSNENIIQNLFHGRPKYPELIMKQLESIGWKAMEKYYVLVIDGRNLPITVSEIDEIEAILGVRLYPYEDHYVAICGSAWNVELASSDFPELFRYLKKKKRIAGLSYGFFDIMDVSDALQQALYAMDIIIRMNIDVSIYAFADTIITYVSDFCVKNGGLPRERLCYPTVLKIMEYDRKYGTYYLQFLTLYVYSGFNAKKTAEKSNYHINTVYQKLAKLEDFFGLDLKDEMLFVKIYLSLCLFNKEDEVSPKYFELWLKDD